MDAFERSLRQDLADRLGAQASLWQDVGNIRLGQDWKRGIEEAVTGSAVFLALVSPSYQTSEWCAKECKHFFGQFPSLEDIKVATKGGDSYRFLKIYKLPWPNDAHLGFCSDAHYVDFFQCDENDEMVPGTDAFRSSLWACSDLVDTFRKVDTMSTIAKHSKPRRQRLLFTEEFLADAVRLAIDEGRAAGQVVRELDLTESALRNWVDLAGDLKKRGRLLCEGYRVRFAFIRTKKAFFPIRVPCRALEVSPRGGMRGCPRLVQAPGRTSHPVLYVMHPPHVPRQDGPIWPVVVAECDELLGRRRRAPLELRPSVPDAKVQHRPDVESTQREHEVHLGAPLADAPHLRERLCDVLVGLVGEVGRIKIATRHMARELLDTSGFGA